MDEAKIEREPGVEAKSAAELEAAPLRWLHATRAEFELLDKPIVFDDAQEAVRRLPAPVVLVGSAGSGKTAVTLAKLREAQGRVLYVTQSAYLAQSARSLYDAHGYENAAQEDPPVPRAEPRQRFAANRVHGVTAASMFRFTDSHEHQQHRQHTRNDRDPEHCAEVVSPSQHQSHVDEARIMATLSTLDGDAPARLAALKRQVTDRRHTRGVALITGHSGEAGGEPDWAVLARSGLTLLVYMGVARVQQIVSGLIDGGLPPQTPAAVVSQART